MDLRKLVFRALREDQSLADRVGDRIYQAGSLSDDVPPTSQTPYLVYKLGTEGRAGPSAIRATTRSVEVWAHDQVGDYFVIDEILDRAKVVLEAVDNQGTFLEIRFTNKSPDLWDDVLKHIVRFSRFQATLTE